MILIGSQRGGPGALTRHLLNDFDNDHVEVVELRGFIAEDLGGALDELDTIAKGTRCKQFLFSLSLNPPKGAEIDVAALVAAADRAEERLGLQGQPRAIVTHEKNGRRHIHAVWSRIDVAEMKAVNMSFFANRLAALSKELYLEHGWELPEGHRENGWKNPLNFTLAEWQQAKRLGLDPREVKQQFQAAWRESDGYEAFRAALEDKGYYLARGDRRGFVAVDVNREVFSVSRMTGVTTKELATRLGPTERLPSVDNVLDRIGSGIHEARRKRFKEVRARHDMDLAPLLLERKRLLADQRRERRLMSQGQRARLQAENRVRQGRITHGIRGLWDVLTGRAATIRRENDLEAFTGYRRDADQRERMVAAQMKEREALHQRTTALRKAQRRELMNLAALARHLIPDRAPEAAARTTPRSARGMQLEP